MSEKTNRPTNNPINDSTIRANRSKVATDLVGQNRIAFCYRKYIANILDEGDDIDYFDSQDEQEYEIVEYHLEQFLNQIEGDEESVSVIVAWKDGSFTFFPRVKNDMHAVFSAADYVFPAFAKLFHEGESDCCWVSVNPYLGSCFEDQIDPDYLDTDKDFFETAEDFFAIGGNDGR
jgi:hypothetical protein